MPENKNETKIIMVHEPGEGEANLDTMGHLPEVRGSDSEKIRAYIDNYAKVMVAAQFIIDKKDRQLRQDRHYVLSVKNTKKLLMDGRMAAEVSYGSNVHGGVFREHTLVPLKSLDEIVTRMESGEIPVLGNELPSENKEPR